MQRSKIFREKVLLYSILDPLEEVLILARTKILQQNIENQTTLVARVIQALVVGFILGEYLF